MNLQRVFAVAMGALAVSASVAMSGVALAQAQAKKPNIVVIMGDNVGIWNIGAYHRGTIS